ncbi:hypothetical protein [Nocardioides sp.]|uniref:hypothetical protein n=1 Tax=Nocardioides sp. TaxID=35761 RepID=UPI0035AFD88E
MAGGFLGNFFDLQARAFLDGHVDLAPGSIGIEGFIHDGKTYTYFPPFPALLRLPVIMTTHEFDGRLTLLSMAIAWLVFATVCVKLVWFLVDRLCGPQTTRGTAALVGIFVAGATGGSFLTFDASLPWTYHEVYVWAVTGATGSLYWLLRSLSDHQRSSYLWLFWFALITIGTRATEGWAICLTIIGVALIGRFRPRSAAQREGWWRLLLAGAVPLAMSIALNLYKFDSVYMFPLQTQVWTEISAQRRAALAANGGSLTGPQFFTTSFMAYLRPDGIRFVDYFPWITLPASPPPAFHGAFVDQAYRTGSITAFMPAFMVGFVAAVVAAFRPRAGEQLRVLRAPLVASVLVTGGVMAYGYYSNRYTSEFVPAMVLGGAVGIALLARLLTRAPRLTAVAVPLAAVAAAFSIAAQMSTGAYAAATMARGEALERYLSWQQTVSGGRLSVTEVDDFPSGGETDDLAVQGDCDSVYLNIGDAYEPWITVAERDWVVDLARDGRIKPGVANLVRVDAKAASGVDIRTNEDGQVRFELWDAVGRAYGGWYDLDPADATPVRVGVRHLTDFGVYRIDGLPGGTIGQVTSRYLAADVTTQPSTLRVTPATDSLSRMGLRAEVSRGAAPAICAQIADHGGPGTAD